MKETQLTKDEIAKHDLVEHIALKANTAPQLRIQLVKMFNRLVPKDMNILITGHPGSGKSTVGALLKNEKNVISMDRFGKLNGSQWKIDEKNLAKMIDEPSSNNVIVGTSDNMLDVLRAIKPVAVIYIKVSDNDLYRNVMLERSKDESDPFKDEFKEMASFTDDKIDQRSQSDVKKMKDWGVDVIKVVSLPTISEIPVTDRGEKLNFINN